MPPWLQPQGAHDFNHISAGQVFWAHRALRQASAQPAFRLLALMLGNGSCAFLHNGKLLTLRQHSLHCTGLLLSMAVKHDD